MESNDTVGNTVASGSYTPTVSHELPSSNVGNNISEKKLRRLERRAEKKERFLHFRKIKRKERKVRIQALKKEQLQQSYTQVDANGTNPSDATIPRHQNIHKMCESQCHIRVAIECSMDALMKSKDIGKLHHQLTFAYGMNRRTPNPLQFYITNIQGQLDAKMRSLSEDGTSLPNWDANLSTESFLDLFSKEEIVYLCAESDTELLDLRDDRVYVIGGLVDHNHHKGACYARAQQLELATARLPLQGHVELNSRAILSIPHVFEILLRFSETRDWRQSLLAAIPKRKLAMATTPGDNDAVEEIPPVTETDAH